jgi:hypothetical protein
MLDYWKEEDKGIGISGAEATMRDRMLKEEMFPDELTVPAAGRLSRLLIFNVDFPRTGEAKVTIPLIDPDRKLIEKLEFPFSFEQPGSYY